MGGGNLPGKNSTWDGTFTKQDMQDEKKRFYAADRKDRKKNPAARKRPAAHMHSESKRVTSVQDAVENTEEWGNDDDDYHGEDLEEDDGESSVLSSRYEEVPAAGRASQGLAQLKSMGL